MMRVLFDTNIILDGLLKRQPWAEDARLIWQANTDGLITAYVASSTLATVFYVSVKQLKPKLGNSQAVKRAYEDITICLDAFRICTVDRKILEQALTLPREDFEDNLQAACAIAEDLDAIVTRDAKFKGGPMKVMTYTMLIKQLKLRR